MATTFMNLNLPTPTVTLGPEWANQLNAALEVVDQHDHTSDKGQRVPTAGLNINEDLDFNSNKALALQSTQYTEQASALSGATNAASLHTFAISAPENPGVCFAKNSTSTSLSIFRGLICTSKISLRSFMSGKST